LWDEERSSLCNKNFAALSRCRNVLLWCAEYRLLLLMDVACGNLFSLLNACTLAKALLFLPGIYAMAARQALRMSPWLISVVTNDAVCGLLSCISAGVGCAFPYKSFRVAP